VKHKFALSFLVIAIILALPACGGAGAAETNTQTTVSTQAPTTIPTAIQANPTAVVESVQLMTYTHPSNSFSFDFPSNWTIEETGEGDVVCMSPDQSGVFGISVINTGYKLDEDAFETLVTALENNLWKPYKNYVELQRETKDETTGKVILVVKTLDINTIPYNVISVYLQMDQAVYWANSFSSSAVTEETSEILSQMGYSIVFNPEYAKDFVPYMSSIGQLTAPHNLFTMNTPIGWTYQHEEDSTGVGDMYTAPDSLALVMNMYINGDSALSMADAEAQSKELLKQIIGDKVDIYSTEVLDDGHTHWNYRLEDSLKGEVFLKPVGNDLAFLMYFYAVPWEDTYLPAIQAMFDSYQAGQ